MNKNKFADSDPTPDPDADPIIKKSLNSRNQGFSSFLLIYERIRIWIRTDKLRIRMRIQQAQKHTDPTVPDPEHCL
jgi:hypothetical protein